MSWTPKFEKTTDGDYTVSTGTLAIAAAIVLLLVVTR